MKRKFMALALAAAMTVSMTSAVFAADEIKSADDLEGKKIGVQLGTTGDADATEVKDATVERYNKGNDAVMALKQGKIDCVVIDSEPAKKFVEKNDDLEIVEDIFDKEEYAICLSKDNADLTKEFNEALKELKDDGTLDSMEITTSVMMQVRHRMRLLRMQITPRELLPWQQTQPSSHTNTMTEIRS